MDEAQKKYLADLIARLGVRGAARELGLSTDAVARLHGGLPTHRGTVAQVVAHRQASERQGADRA